MKYCVEVREKQRGTMGGGGRNLVAPRRKTRWVWKSWVHPRRRLCAGRFGSNWREMRLVSCLCFFLFRLLGNPKPDPKVPETPDAVLRQIRTHRGTRD